LVASLHRAERLAELEKTMNEAFPFLSTTYSQERIQELEDSIMAASKPKIRDAFVEFTNQIEAYLNEFNLLHEELEEWKELHNLLQDLQINFTLCRGHIAEISRADHTTRAKERILYEVEVEWRPCKRTLYKLQELAENIQVIDLPYVPETGSGPDWFTLAQEIASKIDESLLQDDVLVLAENLSAFGDQIDQFLYLADKALRDVVRKINRLPRPREHIR
jgi:hypothetical protein